MGGKAHCALQILPPQTVALACDLAPFSRLTPSGTIRSVHRAAAKGLGSRPSAKPAGRRPKAGEVARSVSQPRLAAKARRPRGRNRVRRFAGVKGSRLETGARPTVETGAPSGAGQQSCLG